MIRLYRRSDRQHAVREECFYVDFIGTPRQKEIDLLKWLISEPLTVVGEEPAMTNREVLEIGPRLSVETPFSSNAVAICQSMGLPVRRIEMSTRYVVGDGLGISSTPNSDEIVEHHLDRMTQVVYESSIATFDTGIQPESVTTIAILENGEQALREANTKLGLGMDDWDVSYYTKLFQRLGRNPTNVELFQVGNANSEHSRHWFFRGVQVIDGTEMKERVFQLVQEPWRRNRGNSITASKDNSGVIRGVEVLALAPRQSGHPCSFKKEKILQHITGTAETHNHPTLIAPFPGAETGSGGRIRDSRAVGRGGLVHAGLAGYCVGNLHISGYEIPGEHVGGESNRRTASPLEILVQGSNGVSDYGNKIGEPLLGGFCRSFGQMVNGARREFRKPVLYSAGFGRLNDIHVKKCEPETGMCIVRIGGPAYRIGVGGGSASSMIHGTSDEDLDFKSVQRGNAEMENRVNRVIQTCAEMGVQNPIESIHDQGAGGPSNVLTELMEPAGGRVDIRKIVCGDQTMSVLEIWVAEYQEGYGLLVRPESLSVFQVICERERVNCEVVGEITGDGNVVVIDSALKATPVNLSLADILSEMPQKRFTSNRAAVSLPPFTVPQGLSVEEALRGVFLLPQVGSKGFLVRKVDRSVTGLVARQQCCGPMQVPVADVAVTADGYFGLTGAAVAIGEQPVKMLIAPDKGARMAVAEMITNLASAKISQLPDVKCRANWMWAAKRPSEGAQLYDAAVALRGICLSLGIAIDGGKDSLSMATMIGDDLVVSPGELVIMGYAPVPDITKVATPDFKGDGLIGLIDLGNGKNRLGGSSLAQMFGQIGNDPPDIDDPDLLKRAFEAVQELIEKDLITAYHDRSDGGLITAIAEMCIAGNCGARLHIFDWSTIPTLFSEEAGMIFECKRSSWNAVMEVLRGFGVPSLLMGNTNREQKELQITKSGASCVFSQSVLQLRQSWEATSTELEKLQANPEMVQAESESHAVEAEVDYRLSFTPRPAASYAKSRRPKVAVVREEGTNGDREMAAALYSGGLDPWDISMSDLVDGRLTTLETFRGLVFPGGFSYADVFGSAKGWAGPIRFNPRVRDMLDSFYARDDTFSLGVCNGCQLMAQIGWLPWKGIPEDAQPRLVHNKSGRFESRWATIQVLQSPSVLLRGMAGSTLGIQVAHGEGRLLFPDPHVADEIRKQQLVPLVYVDVDGNATEAYPYNPNGSPEGWTALCSRDGRHLAMMPHPERCFLKWQWPYMPEKWRGLNASPWLKMFQNARSWCLKG